MSPSFRQIRNGCSTLAELIKGIWRSRYWWVLPVVFLLIPPAIVFVVLQAVPVVAPFVYAIF